MPLCVLWRLKSSVSMLESSILKELCLGSHQLPTFLSSMTLTCGTFLTYHNNHILDTREVWPFVLQITTKCSGVTDLLQQIDDTDLVSECSNSVCDWLCTMAGAYWYCSTPKNYYCWFPMLSTCTSLGRLVSSWVISIWQNLTTESPHRIDRECEEGSCVNRGIAFSDIKSAHYLDRPEFSNLI